MKKGQLVSTPNGAGTILSIREEKDSFYGWTTTHITVKYHNSGREAETTAFYVKEILRHGADVVIFNGSHHKRYTIEEFIPQNNTYKMTTGEQFYANQCSEAPPMINLPASEWKRVKKIYKTGEFPDIENDPNGDLVVPTGARFSYFWTEGARACHLACNVNLVD